MQCEQDQFCTKHPAICCWQANSLMAPAKQAPSRSSVLAMGVLSELRGRHAEVGLAFVVAKETDRYPMDSEV